MGISLTTQKQLWARSYNRCAICGRTLVQHAGGQQHTIGEVCHIVAKENGGPRANPAMSDDEKDSYDNLIILCPTHHTLIDKIPTIYTVDKLKEIKFNHENSLGYELKEIHNSFIKKWDELCTCEEWEHFTSNFLFASGYEIHNKHYTLIKNFISFYRRMPREYFQILSLDKAFESYVHALYDFISKFDEYSIQYGADVFSVRKFYKDYRYPESDIVFKKYDTVTTDLVNLLAELTRSINLIIDRIESNIIPNYSRIHGYVCLDNSGITISGYGEKRPLHYFEEMASVDKPYEGLDKLKQDIKDNKRDYWFNLQG